MSSCILVTREFYRIFDNARGDGLLFHVYTAVINRA